MTDTKDAKITIDEKEYAVADLSEAVRAHIANIQFVDQQIQQLNEICPKVGDGPHQAAF
jgi:hypothetical protein